MKKYFYLPRCVLCLIVAGLMPVKAEPLPDPEPVSLDYFAEPTGLPYAETILNQGTEPGFKWTEFRYTSMIYEGQSVRIHALYAVPDSASATNKVPAIVLTHGKFGRIDHSDPRYWAAVTDLAKAGYAVLFFEWNPDPQMKAGPLPADAPEPNYTTFPTIDYSKNWNQPEDDWKKSIFYQAMIAGKRAITWLEAKPEVDANRIGATGASYGGIFSSLLAAIDLRIVAVSPTVYAAGFGADEPSYNCLSPKLFTPEQIQSWRSRFDSQLLLNKRAKPVPLLYLVASNDPAFNLLKTMKHYQALPEPKQMVIAPNEGHNFWNFRQTVLFFDQTLKNEGTRPKIGVVQVSEKDGGWKLAVESDAEQVDYYTLQPLIDMSVRENLRVEPQKWKWEKLPALGPDHAAVLVLKEEDKARAQNFLVFARGRNADGAEVGTGVVTVGVRGSRDKG